LSEFQSLVKKLPFFFAWAARAAASFAAFAVAAWLAAAAAAGEAVELSELEDEDDAAGVLDAAVEDDVEDDVLDDELVPVVELLGLLVDVELELGVSVPAGCEVAGVLVA
jgi:hypothetical protein